MSILFTHTMVAYLLLLKQLALFLSALVQHPWWAAGVPTAIGALALVVRNLRVYRFV